VAYDDKNVARARFGLRVRAKRTRARIRIVPNVVIVVVVGIRGVRDARARGRE